MIVQVYIEVDTEPLDDRERFESMEYHGQQICQVLAKFVGKDGVISTDAKALPPHFDQPLWFEIVGGLPTGIVSTYARAMELVRSRLTGRYAFRVHSVEISPDHPNEPTTYVQDFFTGLKIKAEVTALAA